jgi:predicted nucleic acid-binding Zn ribbon protein
MPSVLTSWKEIAQYLGKGVRTLQRWEALYGLPVRRARGKDDRKAVLAIPEELDHWARSLESRSRSELASLQNEVEQLRAENILLKQQLAQQMRASPEAHGFLPSLLGPDPRLMTRVIEESEVMNLRKL